MDQFPKRTNGGRDAAQTFLPMPMIVPHNGRNAAFLQGEMGVQDGAEVTVLFLTLHHSSLDMQWYLGIGDDGSQKEGVGTSAVFTAHPGTRRERSPSGSLSFLT